MIAAKCIEFQQQKLIRKVKSKYYRESVDTNKENPNKLPRHIDYFEANTKTAM